MSYTTKRGYIFGVPAHDIESLPLEAIQAVKKRSKISFTTEELQFLNIRISESLSTIFKITADLVEVRESQFTSHRLLQTSAATNKLLSFIYICVSPVQKKTCRKSKRRFAMTCQRCTDWLKG